MSYASTFHVPFVYDDISVMIGGPGGETSYLSYFIDPSKVDGVEKGKMVRRFSKTRYVGFMTLLGNYRLGGLNVFGYHAVNLAIHIANAFFLYLVVTLTFKTPVLRGSSIKGYAQSVALFSALLFVTHPLQTEAVTYIVKRFTSLATMFYLLSTVAYAGSRLSDRMFSRFALYGVSVLSAVLAMKTKEIAFTLPLAIMMYEFMFFRGSPRRRILLHVPLIFTMLIIPHAYLTEGDWGNFDSMVEDSTRFLTDMPRAEYLFTQFRVITTYVRMIFFPINQNIDHDYNIFRAFLDPPVVVSLLFLAGMFLTGLYLLSLSKAKPELRLVSFGVFWFFLTLSVESSLMPLREIMVEYRMYLPSAGAFISFVSAAYILSEKMQKGRVVITAVFALVSLTFAVATFERNEVWQSEVTLWEDVVKKSPSKARGYINLGVIYKEMGLLERASEFYRTAMLLAPDYADVHINLANIYMEQGLLDEAIKHYELSIKIRTEKAIEHTLDVTKFDPKLAYAYFKLGKAYTAKGLLEMAIKKYESAVVIKPDYAKAYVNLGMLYGKTGKYDTSIKYSKRALDIEPSVEAFNNLGMAYRSKGDSAVAEEYFRKAKALRSPKE